MASPCMTLGTGTALRVCSLRVVASTSLLGCHRSHYVVTGVPMHLKAFVTEPDLLYKASDSPSVRALVEPR